jgi:hypothetical protein
MPPLGDTLCVDRYEASVWRVPGAQTALVKKLKRGKATLADLTAGGRPGRGVSFRRW